MVVLIGEFSYREQNCFIYKDMNMFISAVKWSRISLKNIKSALDLLNILEEFKQTNFISGARFNFSFILKKKCCHGIFTWREVRGLYAYCLQVIISNLDS